jgi:benzoyl-CoA reductase/2-hydroxyglutaryl-CoA dehydratase subunit BcrC/BadD/HgdB
MGLKGEFDFVDGLVWLNTCDNVRRIYDNWKRNVDTPFLGILSFPRKAGQPQVEWYCNELAIFKESIEAHFNVKITDERLWEAIRTHNRTRSLQRSLYDLRKNEAPPITGAEMLAVMVAGTAMPRQLYNRMLSELLDEITREDGITDYRARLMIVGSILDDPSFVKIIEDQGALVVTDSLCFGSRLVWKNVDEAAGDPLDALAKYYVAERPSCPRTFGKELERGEFIRDLVGEFRVDGIIAEQMKFCDIWTIEHFMLGKDFKEAGIPCLKLDREYVSAGIGQLRTRVQAFLETIGGS